ncbi:aminoacyl-tRNA hydrolase [Tuberibacillus sp. Marseille-P3662]|uniref:aminoacyl-tRNA hydrolase n=1 Tax=Tuberibacillus sp. Marseille-P3662 TaxID=1965358 RepID=UPI000A1CCF57|nr:aminoacyl-tRNA hydrolase [Tuberibacillus sp. Marseille-P3662]
MKLIAGLGNPGKKFEHTRHNIGFDIIDHICDAHNVTLTKTKFNALFEKTTLGNEDVVLVKPLTYMNLSGEAIAPLMNFYKIPLDQLLVVYDDLDLPVGRLRLRQTGGPGGHNGIKDIIAHLGSRDFKRVRVGIGRPDGQHKVIDYVLKKFDAEQQSQIDDVIDRAANASFAWCEKPFNQVMNDFNQ